VAVDPKRVRGIARLASAHADLDVVLLDDAFQHRYVKPGINILLVDYHRLIIYDRLLPAGRLREPVAAKHRADIVIVTKCPQKLKPMDYRVITKAMDLFPYQQLYFTTLEYDHLQPLFPHEVQNSPLQIVRDASHHHVLLLAGIASPRHFQHDVEAQVGPVTPMVFPDHHNFTPRDAERINAAFAALPHPKCIFTTEKDAVRLEGLAGLSAEVRSHLYALPIRVRFIQKEHEDKFNEYIIGYVRKNSRNSILVKSKDDNKS